MEFSKCERTGKKKRKQIVSSRFGYLNSRGFKLLCKHMYVCHLNILQAKYIST